MRHFNVSKHHETGFTLIELLVAILMMGIMAAIATPGMLGFLARSKVTSATSDLQGLLQEAQRSSIQSGKTCVLALPTTGSKSSDASNNLLTVSASFSTNVPPASCLKTGSRTLPQVKIRHNFTDVNGANAGKLFDYKGSTDSFLDIPSGQASGDLVIVLSPEDSAIFQKCIVVSDGLGLIRVGNYPNNATDLDRSKCTPTY